MPTLVRINCSIVSLPLRMGAIAFAREGADVAINYLPVEEPDAREVIQLIRSAERKAVAIPGDIRNENFCNQLVVNAVREPGGLINDFKTFT